MKPFSKITSTAMQKIEISSAEYIALLNVDRFVRMAMTIPETGEFLAAAIQALDAVRRDEGLTVPDEFKVPDVQKQQADEKKASDLLTGLIGRMKQ